MTADTAAREDFAPELAALLPSPLPELVTPGWVTDLLGITPRAVINAILNGTLPAKVIHGGGVRKTAVYAIDPRDAVHLWGHKFLRRQQRQQGGAA